MDAILSLETGEVMIGVNSTSFGLISGRGVGSFPREETKTPSRWLLQGSLETEHLISQMILLISIFNTPYKF